MNLTITQTDERQTGPFLEVLRNRNFRLLWIGEAFSVLGDHLYIVALPWLVLQLTGDALAMGAVLGWRWQVCCRSLIPNAGARCCLP